MQGEALRDKQCANTVKSYVDQWELSESMIEPRVPYSALPALPGKKPSSNQLALQAVVHADSKGTFH